MVGPEDLRAQRFDRDSIELAGGLVEPRENTETAPKARRSEAALVIDPAELADPKRAKRAQTANVLLKVIHSGRPSIAKRHRSFLADVLNPDALQSGEWPWISATSIVQEL